MAREHTDVLISGGGIAGLIAAAALGDLGYSVILVDPNVPITDDKSNNSDFRSTAYLQPAKQLLDNIGIWGKIAPIGVPLNALRIVDTTGDPAKVRDERTFHPDNTEGEPFGWNFVNWRMRKELLAHLAKQTTVDLHFGVGFKSVITRTNAAIVSLSDGTQVSCRLLLGADGRNSLVRDASGITANTTRYGQKALAFIATHLHPHDNISTEIYHHGGPFTMVPLADINGKPASAIVWMNQGARAQELNNLPELAFNQEMNDRSLNLFGPFELASPRALWPIITQTTDRLTTQRTALIAEAAHVIPPIGAQGLNTSLHDIEALVQILQSAPESLGTQSMLDTYEAMRKTDIQRRTNAIDIFNRVTRSEDVGLQSLRLAGLKIIHDIKPLRDTIMQRGLGPA